MKICKNCGWNNEDNSNICINCRNELNGLDNSKNNFSGFLNELLYILIKIAEVSSPIFLILYAYAFWIASNWTSTNDPLLGIIWLIVVPSSLFLNFYFFLIAFIFSLIGILEPIILIYCEKHLDKSFSKIALKKYHSKNIKYTGFKSMSLSDKIFFIIDIISLILCIIILINKAYIIVP